MDPLAVYLSSHLTYIRVVVHILLSLTEVIRRDQWEVWELKLQHFGSLKATYHVDVQFSTIRDHDHNVADGQQEDQVI